METETVKQHVDECALGKTVSKLVSVCGFFCHCVREGRSGKGVSPGETYHADRSTVRNDELKYH